MKAIILAAGMGTRLQPFTNNIPKGMVKIFDKSLIEMQIENYQNCGINEITIVTGYCSDKINFKNINYVKNENFALTNMNESLFCAKEQLNDSVIISYSDIIFEKKVIQQLINFMGDIGVVVNMNWKTTYEGRMLHPRDEAENVLLSNNKILEIRKGIKKKNDDQEIAEFLGLIRLSKKGAKKIVEKYTQLKKYHKGKFHNAISFQQAYLTDMVQELIDSKTIVEPIFINGKWMEVDTPEDLERAQIILK